MNKESKAALINTLNVHGVDNDFQEYLESSDSLQVDLLNNKKNL